MNTNIELSEVRVEEMFKSGEAYEWANKVYRNSAFKAGMELSEEEVAFSEAIDKMTKDAVKYGNTQAREAIAQIIVDIIEPKVFSTPNELLTRFLVDKGNYGEFDMVKVRKSPKNTLVARQSAMRTGNVDKSFLDVAQGNVSETYLQIETELPMSNLRRDGAVGVATLAIYALEAFDKARFNHVLNYCDALITSGDQVFDATGAITSTIAQDLLGYGLDNNVSGGTPLVVGLSNKVREVCKSLDVKHMSEQMKDNMNTAGTLQHVGGCDMLSVTKGKTLGDGVTKLLPENRVFVFADTIGEMYTKGELITRATEDNNSEKIHLKFSGLQFGVCVTDTKYIGKIAITA